jgi:hypothetical protein
MSEAGRAQLEESNHSLILLYVCPHTTVRGRQGAVGGGDHLITQCVYMCPHNAMHVSSYYHLFFFGNIFFSNIYNISKKKTTCEELEGAVGGVEHH